GPPPAAGRIKGGLGSASLIDEASGLQVGALLAANPVGSVLWPGSRRLLAAGIAGPAETGAQPSAPEEIGFEPPAESRIGGHTCIGVVATNATLSKAEAQRIAIMAHDGLARAIRPVHTPMDGDTIFAIATGRVARGEPAGRALAIIGAMAADCVTRAVARAVVAAGSLGPWPAYASSSAG
ncbi:MAG: P1 family peptidase, partial [Alphaproteobacteria bacterium]|nr:P1 family peptidase [Alphaproteobacteria bacterium]